MSADCHEALRTPRLVDIKFRDHKCSACLYNDSDAGYSSGLAVGCVIGKGIYDAATTSPVAEILQIVYSWVGKVVWSSGAAKGVAQSVLA